MEPLYVELNRWKAEPFVWGSCDCMLVLGDWLVRIGMPDPFSRVRLTYDSALSCERVTGFMSDPLKIAAECFEGVAGLERTTAKSRGDVAVVAIKGKRMPFGALWTGTCWACKGEEGQVTLKPMLVREMAVWGAGYAA